MRVISERNVEAALFSALILFKHEGVEYPSRNGPMIELPTPVTTVYSHPTERVVFSPARDCNPFLHFFESLWMLAGDHRLEFLQRFTGNMDQFSDDERTLNGAYGYRWRHHFGYDQLDEVIRLLRADPFTRRAVLSIWDGVMDLRNQSSRDLPCNTQVHFRLRDGVLDMSVLNRSNDAIWGAYGANAVHFSFLLEYVALAVGARVGVYRQVSNSLHLYPDIPVAARMLTQAGASPVNYYGTEGGLAVTPLLAKDEEHWELDTDLHNMLLGARTTDFNTDFMRGVAGPMMTLWETRALDDPAPAQRAANAIKSWDWRLACIWWVNRRRDRAGRPLLQDRAPSL